MKPSIYLGSSNDTFFGWTLMLPNVLQIDQAWVLETEGQPDRKTVILNPNRRRSCLVQARIY